MQVRGSSGWTNAGSSVNGTSRRFEYVATAGQTTFSGADANTNTLVYDAGFIDVYLNGSRLKSTDFTATSGTSVVLAVAAAASDELNIVAYGTFQVANLNGADLQTGTVTPAKLSTGSPSWDSSGNLTLAGGQLSLGANGQIKFPATQNASADANTLDDYEEGTWTPVINRYTTSPSHTLDVAQGTYIKVGRMVHVSVNIHISALGAAGAGYNLVTGIPFPIDNSNAIWSGEAGSVAYNNAFSTSVASGITHGAGLSGFAFLPSGARTQTEINENWTTGYLTFSTVYRTTQ